MFGARIVGLITIVWRGQFQCHWLISQLFKYCECQVIFYLSWRIISCSFKVIICNTRFYYSIFFILKCRDLSNNHLSGVVPDNGSFSLFTPIRFDYCQSIALNGLVLESLLKSYVFPFSFANNLDLCGPVTGHPCPGSPPFPPPPPFVQPPPISSPGNLLVILSLNVKSVEHLFWHSWSSFLACKLDLGFYFHSSLSWHCMVNVSCCAVQVMHAAKNTHEFCFCIVYQYEGSLYFSCWFLAFYTGWNI